MARLRELIVPREHGVWGLLAGAALVGLPLGGSLAGLPLLGAGICAAMLRQTMSVKAAGRGRFLVAALLASLVAGLVAITVLLAVSTAWAWWFSAAVLTGVVCLLPVGGRPWWISAIAALATGLLTVAIAVAGGGDTVTAAIAGAALAAHLIAIVPLVRAQLRSDPRWPALAVDLHVAAFAIAAALWAADLVYACIPAVFGLGLVRAVCLLDKQSAMPPSPARIGAREMAWLLVVAGGVHLGLRGPAC